MSFNIKKLAFGINVTREVLGVQYNLLVTPLTALQGIKLQEGELLEVSDDFTDTNDVIEIMQKLKKEYLENGDIEETTKIQRKIREKKKQAFELQKRVAELNEDFARMQFDFQVRGDDREELRKILKKENLFGAVVPLLVNTEEIEEEKKD